MTDEEIIQELVDIYDDIESCGPKREIVRESCLEKDYPSSLKGVRCLWVVTDSFNESFSFPLLEKDGL